MIVICKLVAGLSGDGVSGITFTSISFCRCFYILPLTESSLRCDLTEAERALILDKFLHATMKWNQNAAAVQSGNENEEQKSHMIVATDACLPLITSSGESSISSNFLINYQLPTKKETYTRRMATCLAADGTVINMVVGGEAVTLKSIEESSRLVIAEMPINRFLKCSKDVILQVRGRELLGRGGFVHCALSFKY